MATLEPENRVPDPSTEEAGVVQQFKDFVRPYVSRMRSLDDATAQLDLMFLPEEDSPPRRDRRWAEA